MLVAAGFGTRLHPLTHELPKPALPVGNRPIAFYACDHLARSGVTEVVVNTHHLASQLRGALEPVCPPGLALRFVHEAEILGTGGGVRNAWRPRAGEDFIAFNAKLLFAPDLERALHVHREARAIATMVLRPMPEGARFDPVEVDGEGRVRRIRNAPAATHGTLEQRMYTGVQILSERAFRDLPERGDIIEHAYHTWLARGDVVASVTETCPWMDVGVTPHHYLDANLALLEGRVAWPGIVPVDSCLIAPGARVGSGATLDRVVLGAGAEVSPGAQLARVVAWPEAVVAESLSDAVVTTSGRVVRL